MCAATSAPARSFGEPVYENVNVTLCSLSPLLLSQIEVLWGFRSLHPTKSQPAQLPAEQGFCPRKVPLPPVLKRPNAEKPMPDGGAPPLIELRTSCRE